MTSQNLNLRNYESAIRRKHAKKLPLAIHESLRMSARAVIQRSFLQYFIPTTSLWDHLQVSNTRLISNVSLVVDLF